MGGGVTKFSETERPQKDVIPKGVTWIPEAAARFDPDNQSLTTDSQQTIKYDYLVACPGIQIDWQHIKGLSDSLGKNGVCSNYSKETVEKTWDFIRDFQGGTALFTFPNTPIKCAGAPQKIMYLAEEQFRRAGIRDKTQVIFVSAGAGIFGVKKYADALNKVIEKRGIKTLYKHNLERIDAAGKLAVFRNLETGETKEIKFDMLHVAPPMSAPDFIKESPLAGAGGWIDVDKQTLQHVRFSQRVRSRGCQQPPHL